MKKITTLVFTLAFIAISTAPLQGATSNINSSNVKRGLDSTFKNPTSYSSSVSNNSPTDFKYMPKTVDYQGMPAALKLAVNVESPAGGGVPIGTIISWPVKCNPEEMYTIGEPCPNGVEVTDAVFSSLNLNAHNTKVSKWLECNGQTINASVYPELSALMGTILDKQNGWHIISNRRLF